MATSMIEDSAQADNRAKVRIGVAIALIITAIAILALLSHRKSDTPAQAATEAPSTQTTSNAEPESIKETTPTEPAGKAEADSADSHQISSPPPVVNGDELAKTETPIADKTKADTSTSNAPPPPVVGQLPPVPTTTPPANPITKHTSNNDSSQKAPLSPAQVIATPPASATTTPTPTPVAATAAKPVVASASTAPAPKAFEVQLGVFSDPENAKQLQAKLAAAGIPAHLETRLQVGPFQNRAEADAARDKIKALGINSVIVGKQ